MEYLICIHQQNSKIIGYTTLNIPQENLLDIKRHTYTTLSPRKIDNAKITSKEIETTNGAISRYPLIKNNQIKNKDAFILLGYYGNEDDKTYVYCDYKGQIYKNKSVEVRNKTFANAKVVKGNGVFLAFISGECPKFNITIEEKSQVTSEETIQQPLTVEQMKEVLVKAKPKNSQFLIETGNIQQLLNEYVENLKQYVKDNNTLNDLAQKLSATSYKPIRIGAPVITPELKSKNFSYSMLGA